MPSYNSFSRWIHKLYGRDATMYFSLHHKNILEIDTIIVEKQCQGLGTKIFNSIIEYAKKHGWALSLDPSSEFGGEVSRLVKFYKRLGFVFNEGENKIPRAYGVMVQDFRK